MSKSLKKDGYISLPDSGGEIVPGHFSVHQVIREMGLTDELEPLRGIGASVYYFLNRKYGQVEYQLVPIRHFVTTKRSTRKEQRGEKRFYPNEYRESVEGHILAFLKEQKENPRVKVSDFDRFQDHVLRLDESQESEAEMTLSELFSLAEKLFYKEESPSLNSLKDLLTFTAILARQANLKLSDLADF
jgi:hypothetical protein